MSSFAHRLLKQEARALLMRLGRVKPFALQVPMVPAASIHPDALGAIDGYLAQGRRQLHANVRKYLAWLNSAEGMSASAAQAQRRFAFLRLRFNVSLSQLDIFSDALVQRAEHDNGVWLAGLDVVAADALELSAPYYNVPPVICYLDRGHGAAIRRARTRLPGGGVTPVAVIRVPRERMIGSGIASSLVHETGHQASDLLGLLQSLRPLLQGMRGGSDRIAWHCWSRWISEILSDFWSVAKLGITATLGLIGVVSLPTAFVFRISLDDPHPFPFIRAKVSCAMGDALFPHPQWSQLAQLWESMYPVEQLDANKRALITELETSMPALTALLVNHRPKSLRGHSLKEVLSVQERMPDRLTAYHRAWSVDPGAMLKAPPTLVFAAIGQARFNGEITPEEESRLLADLLQQWSFRRLMALSARSPVKEIVGQQNISNLYLAMQ